MTVKTGPLEITRYSAQYELLRGQVVGPACEAVRAADIGQPRGIGLALLLRDGMPGWIKAVEGVLRSAAVPEAAGSGGGGARAMPENCLAGAAASAPLSNVQRHDITALLVNLVLSTCGLAGLAPSEGHSA